MLAKHVGPQNSVIMGYDMLGWEDAAPEMLLPWRRRKEVLLLNDATFMLVLSTYSYVSGFGRLVVLWSMHLRYKIFYKYQSIIVAWLISLARRAWWNHQKNSHDRCIKRQYLPYGLFFFQLVGTTQFQTLERFWPSNWSSFFFFSRNVPFVNIKKNMPIKGNGMMQKIWEQ